jgi:hypothetical protein
MKRSIGPLLSLAAALVVGLGAGSAHALCGQTAPICGESPFLDTGCTSLGGLCEQVGTVCDCFVDGMNVGDPHMTTYDGLLYDFQAAGEFVLTTDNQGFEVQVRTQPMNTTVSVTTAVATMVGATTVGVYAGKLPHLHIDGTPIAMTCSPELRGESAAHVGACSSPIELPGGGSVSFDGHSYTITWPDASHQVTAAIVPPWMNVTVHAGVSMSGEMSGLLGDSDGHWANDIRTSSGLVLPWPVSFDDFYGQFANSWRIPLSPRSASYFDYDHGESTEFFTDLDFPARPFYATDLEAAQQHAAELVCREAGVVGEGPVDACTLDVAELGAAAAEAFVGMRAPQQTLPPLQLTSRVVLPPLQLTSPPVSEPPVSEPLAGCSVSARREGTAGWIGAGLAAAAIALGLRRRARRRDGASQ